MLRLLSVGVLPEPSHICCEHLVGSKHVHKGLHQETFTPPQGAGAQEALRGALPPSPHSCPQTRMPGCCPGFETMGATRWWAATRCLNKRNQNRAWEREHVCVAPLCARAPGHSTSVSLRSTAESTNVCLPVLITSLTAVLRWMRPDECT